MTCNLTWTIAGPRRREVAGEKREKWAVIYLVVLAENKKDNNGSDFLALES
jgi:hypothetical protein